MYHILPRVYNFCTKNAGDAGGQSRKRLRQQELPCILKASTLPLDCNAQAGDVPNSPASPAGQIPCRPDTQQAFQNCTAHVETQAATAEQPTPEKSQQQPHCISMAERDTMGQEAWALPASAMEPAAVGQSPLPGRPAEKGACNNLPQRRTAEGLPCSPAPSGQQAVAGAGHNSRDPRRQAPAERPASPAATGVDTPLPVLPMGTCQLTRPARDNGSVTAAGRNAVGRESQPCRVFDCGEPVAAVSAGAAALTGPVVGRQLALSWHLQPDHHFTVSNHQQQKQCEGGPRQQLTPEAAVWDTEFAALQAHVNRLESGSPLFLCSAYLLCSWILRAVTHLRTPEG